MTRKSGRLVVIGAAAAAVVLLVSGAASAHGGQGAGHGAGCGAGSGCGAGFGCVPAVGAQGDTPGCGGGSGPWHGGPGMRQGIGGAGSSLLTDEERAAHRAKMHGLASYDECQAYITEFSKQLQDRAKEKGQTIGGPNVTTCDRMKAHGHFAQ